VQEELAHGRIVVIAGFQGVSERKEVTTLGRGGSDTTAVAMAAALDAEHCEICSDVDGVYSADPRVVPDARRIATLSYEETQEMAEAGAKVLNPQAVEFAKQKGIAIYARATSGPLPGRDPSVDGTVVWKNPRREPGTAVGVASQRDIIVLRGNVPSADVQQLLHERGVEGKLIQFGESPAVLISRDNLHDEAHFSSAIANRFNNRVQMVDGLAAISVVGSDMNSGPSVASTGSKALSAAGISPAATSTSQYRITWFVPANQADEGVRCIHRCFIKTGL
jgi:aspartate kinase